MIELSQVKKSYQIGGETIDVLREINMKIEPGEYLSIMGPSGSGKSTIMNIIGCLDRPTSGIYRLDGEDISSYGERELAGVRNRLIGFVFQQFQLLPRLNAIKNVELPMIYSGVPRKERRERAERALEKVGLKDRMRHMPNELSGGQKQRVAIARAIVNEPKLILADEPTGALDTKTSRDIMEQFTELNEEGTTVVLVTHEPEIADYTSRIIMVRDGVIVSPETERRGTGNESHRKLENGVKFHPFP
ncbi:ABC transporter ATP-binding protein [Bacillus haynesii]|uniref:ABC transporter ATP-binding protein n=1 Tax=Bacillus haynesii TaxID=1925021 RepID=UPI00227FA9E6|nr:ABC transporter ATP-binding protein [Bacillus haynesii]MCY7770591.1 ABC transporter ATP-binding protein [Bacillus haynesii]MEC0785411.1 ABC transporter ATP-binding protein [Bacillus haynesii]